MGGKSDAVRAVGAVAQSHQYTLLQDGYHTDDANLDFAWSKEVVKELAESGVKHYITEYPDYMQKYIDGYDKGEYSRGDLTKAFSDHLVQQSEADRTRTAGNFVDMLDAAKKHGIEVHANDVHGPYTNLMEAMNTTVPILDLSTVGELKDALKSTLNDEDATIADLSAKSLEALKGMGVGDKTLLSDNKFARGVGEGFTKERATHDVQIAKSIKEKVGDDKAAISYGGLHGIQKKDLDEHLGNEKVGKIWLTPSAETLKETNKLLGDYLQELPATIIYTDAKDDWRGKHEVQPWQAAAKGIGDELKRTTDFKDAKYNQLDLPKSAMIPSRAVPVEEAQDQGASR